MDGLPLLREYLLATNPNFEEDEKAMDEHRLKSYELFWRDHYLWLEEHGYLLRSRYHPDWVASWKDIQKNWRDCEDAQENRVGMFALITVILLTGV